MTLLRFSVLLGIALAVPGCPSDPNAVDCGRGFSCPEGTQCAASQQVCISSPCGNALVDSGETCDDGNIIDGDGCSASCRVEDCGNGVQDPGELCDDGNTVEGDGCSPDCQSVEVCGNGIKDFGEACDDGGTVPADGCSADCRSTEICGNGIVDSSVGEICDDGNTNNGDACDSTCKFGVGCGNGVIDLDGGGNPIEECDDGNSSSSDNCRADCIVNRCGDGFQNTTGAVDTREACDPPLPCGAGNTCATGFTCVSNLCLASTGSKITKTTETSTCNIDCTASTCGDGKTNGTAGEQCDDNNQTDGDGCDSGIVALSQFRCSVTRCGNGVLTAGETCDDANLADGDGCDSNCTVSACGNGIVDAGAGEECDDGPLNSNAGDCRLDCIVNRCGDGFRNTTGANDNREQCDPAPQATAGSLLTAPLETTTCNIDCTTAACGDGKVNGTAGELCDDNNLVDNDGCDTDPAGGQRPNECVVTECGNGNVNTNEQCDDGNAVNGDGCDTNCTTSACGNGIVSGTEECDLGAGNSNTGDCRADCIVNRCGDGFTNSTGTVALREQCDAATPAAPGSKVVNPTESATCNVDCSTSTCGDGILNGAANEQCDDGNNVDNDGCDSFNPAVADPTPNDCVISRCGNGNVNSGETCDDGNSVNGDGCDNNCTTSACGNGIVAGTEECDNGTANNANNKDCRADCIANRCGDGFTNSQGTVALRENCDPATPAAAGSKAINPTETATCNLDCSTSACSDGKTNSTAGEECDDGNSTNGDGCDDGNGSPATDCTITRCGNGRTTVGEACDDGNTVNADGCTNACVAATCGDGIRCIGSSCPGGASEGCDDGNLNQVAPGSCDYNAAAAANSTCTTCSTTCAVLTPLIPRCGDGTVQGANEVCDDGNATCGTCNATCQVFSSEQATGTIVVVDQSANLIGGTFTLNDGENAAITFEYTLNGVVALGRVPILIALADSAAVVRSATIDAIDDAGLTLKRCADDGALCAIDNDCAQGTCAQNNANCNDPDGNGEDPACPGGNPTCVHTVQCQAISLDIAASAGAGVTVIELVNLRFAVSGNVTINENVNDVEFGVDGMAGGTGGNCANGTACRQNADCVSQTCTANVCAP